MKIKRGKLILSQGMKRIIIVLNDTHDMRLIFKT